ncbi:putative ABC transporter permease [Butyrivibrio sp. YAB3001]|uniref:putative ABC transporter permease n=1 Tax=Butyrivibrio sp. YAB3001 TaxID=1520812 RepID=UPI0008F67DD9|nr:putative ABC transporter permease [Butyrivibrio sp. YAB3001]SFC26175.1 Uncharacterized membrane protein [Butyrivibrio sp. YAB3001]
MLISQYFVEFIFYSFLGWVWESIYCTIKEKKWADRGFLFGPVCPIYGSCVVATSMVFSLFPALSDPNFPIWAIFIICYLGSAVAEFGTSWVLEKRFHARWWDYSELPLNIQGRICVPVSICFGIAGVLIVKYLIPTVENLHNYTNPLVYEVLAIIIAMIFGADYALTEASLSALLGNVQQMHDEFNEKAQSNYEKVASAPKIIGQLIAEEKESVENTRERLVKAYASRLSLNQKRILISIKKFTPKLSTGLDSSPFRTELTENLRTRVRELRKFPKKK